MRQPFGQNFLIDQTAAKTIVDAAELSIDDAVIEIGPGKGILTEIIAPLVRSLTAIEIDRKLSSMLTKRFQSNERVKVINRDFMDFELADVGALFKVISNLPYNVATAIIGRILPSASWQSAVVMVQKEVAERISAKTGGANYSAFSIFCRYFAEIDTVMEVGPESFSPCPKVDSTVLILKNKFPPKPDDGLFQFLKLAFRHRRKVIVNSLSKSMECPKEVLVEALNKAAIPLMSRPQDLTIEQYKVLTSSLIKYIISDRVNTLNDDNDKIW